MRLDLGGIAKGYACGEALEVLEREGCPRALVVGGGDVVLGDPPPGRATWRVELAPLEEGVGACALELTRAAVSTSGDRYRSFEVDGVRYSHIVDPATGLGLISRVAATVVAPDGASADALATALCVMGPERGLALAERRGVQARILEQESGGWRSCETTGWRRIMARSSASAETLARPP
jgi:thiamine biosynthesis lipoprotein